MISRLSKSVKFEASYGLCHKVKFDPGLSSIANSVERERERSTTDYYGLTNIIFVV
jgi:hypothetical protein